LKAFWDQLDNESVLMVGQHFQKNRLFGRSDPESKASDVIRLTSSSPLIIADNTVMFIFLTKNSKLRSELREILKNYEKKIQSVVKDPKKSHAITVTG
jgi:hypothetical protein